MAGRLSFEAEDSAGEDGREPSSSVRISQKSVSRSSTILPRGAASVSGVRISVPGSIEGDGATVFRMFDDTGTEAGAGEESEITAAIGDAMRA